MKQRGLRHIVVLYKCPQPCRVAAPSHLKKIKFPHNVFETRPWTRHPHPPTPHFRQTKLSLDPSPSKILGLAHVRPMDKENWKNTCSNKEKGILRVNKQDTDIHVHYRYKSIWLYIHSSLHIGSLVDGIDKTYITFVVIWPQPLELTVSLKMTVVIHSSLKTNEAIIILTGYIPLHKNTLLNKAIGCQIFFLLNPYVLFFGTLNLHLSWSLKGFTGTVPVIG